MATPETEATEAAAQAAGMPLPVKLLILAIVIALLTYAVIYMRKRFPIVQEFMVFLKERKLWWMTPIVIIFFFLAVLVVTMSSPLAPFIYALF